MGTFDASDPASDSSRLRNVPKLATNGSNWIIYKTRLVSAINAKPGLSRHLNGTIALPVIPGPLAIPEPDTTTHGSDGTGTTKPATRATTKALIVTADEVKERDREIAAAEKRLDEYHEREASVRDLIYSTLSDSQLLRVQRYSTAHDVWVALCSEHEGKTEMYVIALRTRMANTKCSEGADVREHLGSLAQMWEELATMGSPMADGEYCSIICSSLPESFNHLLGAMNATSRMTKIPLTPDNLTFQIQEEYDRRALSTTSSVNQALAATIQKDQGRGRRDPDSKCLNCGRKGHWKADCWRPGGGKEGQGPWSKRQGGKESANAAVDEHEHAYTVLADFALAINSLGIDHPIPRILDTGASSHLDPTRSNFIDFTEIPPAPSERQMDKPSMPRARETLVSASRIAKSGHFIILKGDCAEVRDQSNNVVFQALERNGLYLIPGTPVETACVAVQEVSIDEAHRLLGHITHSVASRLIKEGLVTGIKLDLTSTPSFCTGCTQGKQTRESFPKERSSERAKAYGDLIHTDVWGPAPTESLGRKSYYVTFTDDHSRETTCFLMRNKSETLEKYKVFEARLETQKGRRVKELRSDRGGEYLSKEFGDHLGSQGTIRSLTTHDSPQQNGIAERLNRTLVEHMRAMLLPSGLPPSLWGEALMHAVWLKNRTATRALPNTTPYEQSTGSKPDLSILREFGCKAYVRVEGQSKLESRTRVGHFVGVDSESKAYCIYWPDTRQVSVERNVRFDNSETVGSTGSEGEKSVPDMSVPSTEHLSSTPATVSSSPSLPSLLPDPLHNFEPPTPTIESRPQRIRKPSVHVQQVLNGEGTATGRLTAPKFAPGLQVPPVHEEEVGAAAVEDIEEEGEWSFVWAFVVVEEPEPRSYKEAARGKEAEHWMKGCEKEMGRLKRYGTYILVKPPAGANIIGSKWVFRRKKDAIGKVIEYKARLVAQGFTQTYGVDYTDTFAPVAKLTSIRTILALAARNDWEIHQMDVKSAYLNGTLDEVIYMRQPEGFIEPGKEHLVAQLIKTIYGLKQSGRYWYQEFSQALGELGFVKCAADPCVFYHRSSSGDILIIAIHVDDSTIVANSLRFLSKFKERISQRFEMTDLGEIRFLLGFEITRDRPARTIHLSQRAYLTDIISRFNLTDSYPLSIPIPPGTILSIEQSPQTAEEIQDMKMVPYRELIGALMYASIGTRPDISFSVSLLAQFMSNPGRAHWEAAKRVLRYVKGTLDYRLTYGSTTSGLESFSDADWASQSHRHSISGYIFLIDGGAISWSSKKQPIIALSTAEAEYIALNHAGRELVWLRQLLSEIARPLHHPSILLCDNQSAIALSRDNMINARTKHFDIRYHWIRELVSKNTLTIIYCPTDSMTADILTKSLARPKHDKFTAASGLRAIA
ncbi:hypothetical protein NLI96_g12482 [Meripilus lineatus]|uniref:Polyprotein n=1 Tax=Meripilus lineatus TaxID=2056292 RepID=A0AAD5UPU8_9APHY|nr:hypothetical protein NLI96_g12482 [Physisporinus lineatus]